MASKSGEKNGLESPRVSMHIVHIIYIYLCLINIALEKWILHPLTNTFSYIHQVEEHFPARLTSVSYLWGKRVQLKTACCKYGKKHQVIRVWAGKPSMSCSGVPCKPIFWMFHLHFFDFFQATEQITSRKASPAGIRC